MDARKTHRLVVGTQTRTQSGVTHLKTGGHHVSAFLCVCNCRVQPAGLGIKSGKTRLRVECFFLRLQFQQKEMGFRGIPQVPMVPGSDDPRRNQVARCAARHPGGGWWQCLTAGEGGVSFGK